ncbi:transglycosylase domain-containing protein [Clostridium sp. NSJ-49]|uniref:Penicillin-binding protein 1A n=1 Tax=Clostridium disporicum TaxID=84024 RepID=A0A174CS23_9CLOT|nr:MULTISPECIES: biosynthetic peptidoglycan transglycosylase [Clostridium]MBC5626897.1 transglycosylase domain-containing protein [Clostridium sp. NSJ-49]MCD2502054.1 transglycosylase domain-containing protein [Clostridium sp. NSJ-145]MDU6341346.1 biosynthetic peptidoglycan transglycosylase [Clostridium sp.]CUO16162.1 peptidoglycan glycosyltransferase [Clostridium disporicum]
MKKFFIGLIGLILSIAIISVAMIAASGHTKYKEAIDTISLSDKINEIRSSDTYVEIDDISETFRDAIVAIEDMRFYDHGAIELKSLLRAILVNLREKEVLQGGSTITQQVAKNLYFDNDQNFIKKIAEMFVAFDLEKNYSKDDILELYVNIIYYGDNNYGIKEASNNYFGVEPIDLDYDQSTLLAGLPQAPSAYSLGENYELAKERQEEVIEALEKFKKLKNK